MLQSQPPEVLTRKHFGMALETRDSVHRVTPGVGPVRNAPHLFLSVCLQWHDERMHEALPLPLSRPGGSFDEAHEGPR